VRPGEASATAQRVAAHRLGFERPPSSTGDPAADERLGRDVAGAIDITATSERMVAYLKARTAFFDRAVLDAIAAGIGQVVVVAAGYDGRALRYARPGVRWFELDHPDTQADKRRRLAALGIDAAAVRFVAADVAVDDVAALLLAAGLEPDRPALFTVEGLVAYLDGDVVARLFAALRAVAGAGSRLAASLSTESADGRTTERRSRFRSAVAALGEPLAEPMTPDGGRQLLAAAGWVEVSDEGSDSADRRRRAGLVTLVPMSPTRP
jgi:methyltransferase (TIGR00027 family)